MVNHGNLDRVFGALVNPARRAILMRLEEKGSASISELAVPAAMKLPAMMKHLDVLEAAHLITRAKTGRTMLISLAPEPMAEAMGWLHRYERFWSRSLDRLVVYAEKKESLARKGRRG
jgi:DNA-binding transcriptional ArsR family regulator